MKQYAHGGGHDPAVIQYDFSVNINPLGLPAGVREALTEQVEQFSMYPDFECRQLRQEIAKKEQIASEQIVCGNGALELLYRMIGMEKPEQVLLPVPSFVEYEKAVIEQGGKIRYYEMPHPFVLTGQVLEEITEAVDMMILCCPNNPTGKLVDADLLAAIIKRCQKCEVRLVIDACFLDFCEDTAQKQLLHQAVCQTPCVVVLKAFTKYYAMAGLRLGYLLCADRDWIQRLQEYGACWNVSVPAQISGVAALQDLTYEQQTRSWLQAERRYLLAALARLPLHSYETDANFILLYTEEELEKPLREYGIAIRCCDNYRGLSTGYYRLAIRGHEENVRLVHALEQICTGQDKGRET